ncbi:cellulase family glycosylhydrolase [Microbacterium sp. NEAU-LLC]|uniref:Cellulase family glycosylhydrolase n=1 Tax=Microbacterium helvum TaxID=2773713 RepID=A0ABR8NRK0_9MICO|nr:cellulase family glycosylhydrolase [Microbacterium helvum]MBD3943278.1 cellulase family glycosylhydrolase [Microbacterium helvum]
MRGLRRPIVAVVAACVLIVLQAVADPTGLLALVGWPGGGLQAALVWPLAPYAVFIPVLLGVVWWSAVRAGERFWTMFAGVVLAVLLAQAATAFVMVLDAATAAWAAGYVTAKALPAAAIVAAATRWLGGRTSRPTFERGSVWPAAIAFGALAPIAAGSWWTGAAYAPMVPAPRPEGGLLAMIVAVALMIGAAWLSLRWMRTRVPGVLGAWLGVLVGGALFGIAQAIIGVVVDDGLAGDLWPLMAAYVHVADGLSFAAFLGWVPAVVAVVVDRVRRARSVAEAAPDASPRRSWSLAAIAVAVAVVAALIVTPVAVAGGGVSEARAAAQVEASRTIPEGFLRADGERITDGEGHDVLLRGVNVNQLVDFYQPRAEVPATRPLTEDDFAGMAEYGFDVVRLGISWSALEPTRGELDAGYLERIDQAVEWAKGHGIRTVIDLHQDGWSNAATPEGTVCRPGTDPMWGYDGAPEWATITDGAPRCAFTGRDISPAGDRAFQHFWFDTDGIQTALVRTWGELAARYADEPAVAGFDLMNEPGFGETAPVTTSLLLGRYYDRAIRAIREAGAPQIVFIEPSILWSGLGFDSGPSLAFTDDANIVFSPHLYAESITMDHSLGLPTIVGTARQLDLAARVADEYGVPLWSGEYGYWGDEASIAEHIGRYADAEDAHLLGSAYWVWKQSCGDPQNGIGDVGLGLVPEDCATGEDGARNEPLLAALSRAYPQASPGRLTGLRAEGAALAMTGTVDGATCGLDVWIPGEEEPDPQTEGLTKVVVREVDGGWRVTACAEGDYALTTG